MSESHAITEMLARWNVDDQQVWGRLLVDIYLAVKQKNQSMTGKQFGPCRLFRQRLLYPPKAKY